MNFICHKHYFPKKRTLLKSHDDFSWAVAEQHYLTTLNLTAITDSSRFCLEYKLSVLELGQKRHIPQLLFKKFGFKGNFPLNDITI